MKKILLAIALVMTLGLSASAQRDGFFNYDNIYDNRGGGDNIDYFNLPQQGIGSNYNEPGAPLGTGLLIMTALGAGYAVARRKNRK
jgi:hypothetical protein